ncbi:MAG: hypothetical protein DRP72_02535, partial [Candidatus Omnitrophota bacterium]
SYKYSWPIKYITAYSLAKLNEIDDLLRLTSDKDWPTRVLAVRGLGECRISKEKKESVKEVLLNCAKNDSHPSVKRQAILSLRRQFKEDKKVGEVILKIAKHKKEHQDVREAALLSIDSLPEDKIEEANLFEDLLEEGNLALMIAWIWGFIRLASQEDIKKLKVKVDKKLTVKALNQKRDLLVAVKYVIEWYLMKKQANYNEKEFAVEPVKLESLFRILSQPDDEFEHLLLTTQVRDKLEGASFKEKIEAIIKHWGKRLNLKGLKLTQHIKDEKELIEFLKEEYSDKVKEVAVYENADKKITFISRAGYSADPMVVFKIDSKKYFLKNAADSLLPAKTVVAIVEFLNKKGLIVPKVVPTHEERSFVKLGDFYYTIEESLQEKVKKEKAKIDVKREEIAENFDLYKAFFKALGRAVAIYHKTTQEFINQYPELFKYEFLVTDVVNEPWEEMKTEFYNLFNKEADSLDERETYLVEWFLFLKERIESQEIEYNNHIYRTLPWTIVHADFRDENVIWKIIQNSIKIIGALDFNKGRISPSPEDFKNSTTIWMGRGYEPLGLYYFLEGYLEEANLSEDILKTISYLIDYTFLWAFQGQLTYENKYKSRKFRYPLLHYLIFLEDRDNLNKALASLKLELKTSSLPGVGLKEVKPRILKMVENYWLPILEKEAKTKEDIDKQIDAARALGILMVDEAVDYLLKFLQDRYRSPPQNLEEKIVELKEKIVESLGLIAHPKSIEKLKDILNNQKEHEKVKAAAGWSLTKIAIYSKTRKDLNVEINEFINLIKKVLPQIKDETSQTRLYESLITLTKLLDGGTPYDSLLLQAQKDTSLRDQLIELHLQGEIDLGPFFGAFLQKKQFEQAMRDINSYYDAVVVTTKEGAGKISMQEMIESLRGVAYPEEARVYLIEIPDYLNKGNLNGTIYALKELIRLLKEEGIEFKSLRRIALILGAGSGKRKYPVTLSEGRGNKSLVTSLGDRTNLEHMFYQIMQFYTPEREGVFIFSSDAIKLISNPAMHKNLAQYGIQVLGAGLPFDADVSKYGTMIIDKEARIERFVEKPDKATKERLFKGKEIIPTNWAEYYLTKEAALSLIEEYEDLYEKVELDTAGMLCEPMTMSLEEWLRKELGKDTNLIQHIAIWRAANRLKRKYGFGFVDTGKDALFADTGGYRVYYDNLQLLFTHPALRYVMDVTIKDNRIIGKNVKLGEDVEVEEGVILLGKVNINKGKIEKGAVVINSKINELYAQPESMTVAVQEPNKLIAQKGKLTSDVFIIDQGVKKKVRIIIDINLNIKKKFKDKLFPQNNPTYSFQDLKDKFDE